ncbi:MAG: RDD family protein [bacterium]
MDKKANILHRFIAKAIDLLIFGFLSEMFYPYGFLAGVLYILISDGFFDGESLGKRITGLRVIMTVGEKKPEFKESIIRNSFFAAPLLFAFIPFVGYFLLVTIGIVVYAAEIYFIITSPEGERLGDRFAFTRVIDVQKHK